MNEDNQYDDEDDVFVSRTAIKKSMQAYKEIGEELLLLSDKQLSTIPLDQEILEALHTYKKIKVGNARNRQMSFIAKLIRKSDVEPIQEKLSQIKNQDSLKDVHLRQAEQWRDRLIDTDSNAVGDFISQYPSTDRQQFNQLVRNAIKENKNQNGKSNKYKKALFVLLRDTISSMNNH